MSYFFPEFPDTRMYDADLGWLIRAYKYWVKRYDELLAQVNKMEDDFNNINPTIDAAIKKMQDELNAALNEFETMVNEMIAANNLKINRLIEYVNLQMKEYFDLLVKMQAVVNTFQVYIKRYVDMRDQATYNKLKRYIDQQILKPNFKINNPVYQYTTSVEKAVDDVYKFDSFGIMTQWFDGLRVPVDAFEEFHFQAGEMETKSRWWLWYWWVKRNNYYGMINPWTGKPDSIRNVLNYLIGMHQNGVTAQEFEDKPTTADSIDESLTTAYDGTWSRGWFDALHPEP